jgi:lipoprotein-anchoring transpeptidase ErfK/SrfK
MLVIFLGVVMATILGGAAFFYYSDLIMPGVQVLDIGMGGRTTAEAAHTLQSHWQQRQIVLDAGEATWAVSPETLGITLDVEATAQRAYQQGRSLDAVERLLVGGGHILITPIWQMDPAVAEANLEELAPQLEVPPVNAGVRIVNGRIEVTPPVMGRSLDLTATVARLQHSGVQVVLDGRLELVMVPAEPAISDVSVVAEQANRLLTTALSLHAYDPIRDEAWSWTVTPEVWSSWLRLVVAPENTGQFDWSLDPDQAGAVLTTQAEALGPEWYLDLEAALAAVTAAITDQNPNVHLRVYHHEQQHVVQPGDTLSSIGRVYGIPYPWIQEANAGVESLYPGQVLTIPSPDVLLPLPVVENKRIVVSISQQKMWVYENGQLKWEWLVSTGIESSPTAPGIFQVQSHEPNAYAGNWDLWMPDFMGIYRPVPSSGFMNGFHGFPTRNGSSLLWTGDLGHPVTYGCILISSAHAAQLYDWADEGVVVEVRR